MGHRRYSDGPKSKSPGEILRAFARDVKTEPSFAGNGRALPTLVLAIERDGAGGVVVPVSAAVAARVRGDIAMNGQTFLFPMPAETEALSHRNDPETSLEAAEQFRESGKLGVHRQIVLDGVRRCPGGTHSEIAAVTPLDWLQVARRLPELERAGLVKKGEVRICLVKGSRCTTWWVTDGGAA